MQTKDSTEYGWQAIDRAEYEKLKSHGYAGPGTPVHPERPGYWVMTYEPTVGTVLYTGVSIDES